MKLRYILKLYDALVCAGYVLRKDFCAENNITERTFYRYINEIKDFLEFFKLGKTVAVIDYEGKYYLKDVN